MSLTKVRQWRCGEPHYERLSNEEFPRSKETLTQVEATEGPAERFSSAEVKAVITKMKNNKATGQSGVVVDMIKAAGDAGILRVTGPKIWGRGLRDPCWVPTVSASGYELPATAAGRCRRSEAADDGVTIREVVA